MMMLKKKLLCWLISALILLSACNQIQTGEPTLPPTHMEESYSDLILDEIDPDILADPGIPGCSLADLRPFGWKEVNSGLVDIRTPEDYAIQSESLYQEGYLDYLQTREEYPDRYQSIPEMSYEEFFSTCNVFPEVDFGQYSVLGAHATGTGCTVTFEKHVYRDEQSKKIIYTVAVIEEGKCELTSNNRNLILVPRIPPEYSVEFLIQTTHD
jgi:hypothetical protein